LSIFQERKILVVTFEYFRGKIQKNIGNVADSLSRLDIDSLKIQQETEEVLKLLTGSETTASVISNEQSQCILP
jgi:hypothetical protein